MTRARVNLTLPEDDLRWLREHSEDQGRTLSSQVALLIRRYRAEVEGDRH